ncbi:MAG: hypothetical protein OJF51_002159 [Nitrospira sp.]|nr:MAG: hypothetical protein OJF51_002159 [Nitrospira sp.]
MPIDDLPPRNLDRPLLNCETVISHTDHAAPLVQSICLTSGNTQAMRNVTVWLVFQE